MKEKSFKILCIALGVTFTSILVMIGIYAFCFVGFINSSQPLDLRDFDEGVWKEHHNDYDINNPRAEMTYDLTKNYLKIGMSKEEVINILGQPDRINETYHIAYHLGMQGFFDDPGQLELKFTENRKLVNINFVER